VRVCWTAHVRVRGRVCVPSAAAAGSATALALLRYSYCKNVRNFPSEERPLPRRRHGIGIPTALSPYHLSGPALFCLFGESVRGIRTPALSPFPITFNVIEIWRASP
jgi:hypothetical protein